MFLPYFKKIYIYYDAIVHPNMLDYLSPNSGLRSSKETELILTLRKIRENINKGFRSYLSELSEFLGCRVDGNKLLLTLENNGTRCFLKIHIFTDDDVDFPIEFDFPDIGIIFIVEVTCESMETKNKLDYSGIRGFLDGFNDTLRLQFSDLFTDDKTTAWYNLLIGEMFKRFHNFVVNDLEGIDKGKLVDYFWVYSGLSLSQNYDGLPDVSANVNTISLYFTDNVRKLREMYPTASIVTNYAVVNGKIEPEASMENYLNDYVIFLEAKDSLIDGSTKEERLRKWGDYLLYDLSSLVNLGFYSLPTYLSILKYYKRTLRVLYDRWSDETYFRINNELIRNSNRLSKALEKKTFFRSLLGETKKLLELNRVVLNVLVEVLNEKSVVEDLYNLTVKSIIDRMKELLENFTGDSVNIFHEIKLSMNTVEIEFNTALKVLKNVEERYLVIKRDIENLLDRVSKFEHIRTINTEKGLTAIILTYSSIQGLLSTLTAYGYFKPEIMLASSVILFILMLVFLYTVSMRGVITK